MLEYRTLELDRDEDGKVIFPENLHFQTGGDFLRFVEKYPEALEIYNVYPATADDIKKEK